MSHSAQGIGGDLFPSRYVSDRLLHEAVPILETESRTQSKRLSVWWARVESTCGPATGLRALFDVAAMPLFAALGFHASNAVFDRTVARVRLETARDAVVAALILPWSARPSSVWRAAAKAAADLGTRWCFTVAPPFLSLMPALGNGLRRSVDFSFPDVLDPSCLTRFLTLARAETFDADGGAAPLIDRLVQSAAHFQDRVRSDLQEGVIKALRALLPAMQHASAEGLTQPFQQTLTVLYRVLFLLFAESRDLVPRQHPIYRDAYAIGALCREARSAEPAPGLWDGLAALTRLSRVGARVDDLIVRPFNGRLFARSSAPSLEGRRAVRRPTATSIARDRALQVALVALATRPTRAGREEICYRDLGVEQLGAVYERVLDLDPESLNKPGPDVQQPVARRRPMARRAHSDRRKRTGTFYTPRDLTEFVVRRTLAPLVAGRCAEDILALRVVDPAMGSGAFLVAACRFLAGVYARALVEEGACAEADFGPAERVQIRRLIAERCLAGVDANPIAVQLARLSLWLATLSDGKPLSFLDHRLRTGNSLVGAWPDDLRRIPDRRCGVPPRELPLFDDLELAHSLGQVTRPLLTMIHRPDDTIDDVRAKEAVWTSLSNGRSPVAAWRRAASLWCARWFWPQERDDPAAPAIRAASAPAPSPAELRAAIDAVLKRDATLRTPHLSRLLAVAANLESRHRFLHWPLEFADAFYDETGHPRNRPGFDAVIGNPPWEMLRDDGAGAQPAGFEHRPLVRFIRQSGLYPSCDRGHVNLYQPFLERALSIVRPGGRVGLVLPWGLAVDDGAARLRQRLFDTTAIDVVVGLDNANGLFPIHRGVRFLVLVASPGGGTAEFLGRFGVRTPEEIAALGADDLDQPSAASYPVRLSRELVRQMGGTTQRIPDARRPDDLELLERLTACHPRLGAATGWNVRFGRELNATEDRGSFGDRGLPVLEGKHIQPFLADTRSCAFRMPEAAAGRLLRNRCFARPRLAYRDVAGVANRLSLIAAIVPDGVVTTHTLFCLRTLLPLEQQHFLCGLFNSYVLNAIARMLMGGHLTTSLIEDLPAPVWTGSTEQVRIARLARRLARAPQPARTRAWLQASVARLYALDEVAFASVLAAFPLIASEDRDRALGCFVQMAPRVAL